MYSLDGSDVFLSAWGPGLWLGGSNGILETNFPLMVEMNGIETWSFSCWQLLLWFSTQEQNYEIFFWSAVKNISGILPFYYDWEIRSFYMLKFMKFHGQFQIHFYKILRRCFKAEIQLNWRITPNNQSIWYNVFIERILTYNDSCFHQNRLQNKIKQLLLVYELQNFTKTKIINRWF